MNNSKNINIKSKGIILSAFVLFSVLLIFIPTNVYADEIDITNIGLEETTIITLKNNSNEDVNSLRIWLQEDFNFDNVGDACDNIVLEEQLLAKNIIQIFDLLGRAVDLIEDQSTYIFIYNDGSVEKKYFK